MLWTRCSQKSHIGTFIIAFRVGELEQRYVAWHLKKIKLQIKGEKIRNWKKKSSWLKLSWLLWFFPWIKGELVCKVWCAFFASFFFLDTISYVMRARSGEKFSSWMFSALAVKEQVWSVSWVSLQPSSGSSFSFPCTAFPPQRRGKPVMLGGCYTAQANLLERSLQTSYTWRENLFSKLKKWQTPGNLGALLAYLVNISGFFCAQSFLAKCNMLKASWVTACSMLRT